MARRLLPWPCALSASLCVLTLLGCSDPLEHHWVVAESSDPCAPDPSQNYGVTIINGEGSGSLTLSCPSGCLPTQLQLTVDSDDGDGCELTVSVDVSHSGCSSLAGSPGRIEHWSCTLEDDDEKLRCDRGGFGWFLFKRSDKGWSPAG